MDPEIRPLSRVEYFSPDSIGHVLTLLKEYGQEARLLAGGTDLLVWMKKRSASPSVIVDLKNVPELSSIELKENMLHIGAATKLNDIKASKAVQEKAPALSEAIGFLATSALRNRATIGGNLCSASPAADTAPPLLALDTSATLEGPAGERTVPLSEFFLGPGQTIRRPDEVLRELMIPWGEGRSAFLKLGRRKGFTLSIASAAAFVVVKDGKFEDVRIALGAVAPVPIRSMKAEEMLKGTAVSEDRIEKAAQLVKQEVNPITDVRASAEYRREMACLLAKKVLKKLAMGEE
jgi:carbon-monoxide dehydrogenase medium subunit